MIKELIKEIINCLMFTIIFIITGFVFIYLLPVIVKVFTQK